MSAALDLYTKLTETTDEKERAHLIATAFDALEARFPQISDLATQGHLRESELRLQKEIKGLELQIREVESRLQTQIKEVDARVQERIAQVELSVHKAIAAQTRWFIGGLAVLGAVFKIADLLIGP